MCQFAAKALGLLRRAAGERERGDATRQRCDTCDTEKYLATTRTSAFDNLHRLWAVVNPQDELRLLVTVKSAEGPCTRR